MRLLPFLFAICAAQLASATAVVEGFRIREAPERTRLVVDLSAHADYEVFAVQGPDRVVIDLKRAAIPDQLPKPALSSGFVRGIRHAHRPNGEVRIVVDLNHRADFSHLALPPNQPYGHRVVLDLVPLDRASRGPVTEPAERNPQEFVVVIDAGHGGEDPGAIGKRGTMEKDVNLKIAQRLADRINRQPMMRAELTRNNDYYVGLRDRMDTARETKADLFISIHADAFNDRRVQGSSVYVLSQRGASSEAARWLAQRENKSDRIGGVTFNDKDAMVKAALLDMSQSAQIKSSRDAAEAVLWALGKIGRLHKKEVQHAGFLVLKSPDVPSILIETAFISNPSEEARLKQAKHQRKLADAIYSGIAKWAKTRPAPESSPPALPNSTPTLLADHKHRVERGDTLSEIAARYEVSTESIKFANDMSSDMIHAGDTLLIP